MLESQVSAREIRRRLMAPANGRLSSHLEVVSDPELRRRRIAEASAILEARKAQRDFERRMAIEQALRDAVAERAEAKAIAQKLLGEEVAQKSVTVSNILMAVSRYYGFSTVEICSARRSQQVAMPRHVVMFIAREHTLCSLPQIGMRLGRRDHTTVLSAVGKIRRLIEAGDVRLAADIDNIKWELGIR